MDTISCELHVVLVHHSSMDDTTTYYRCSTIRSFRTPTLYPSTSRDLIYFFIIKNYFHLFMIAGVSRIIRHSY